MTKHLHLTICLLVLLLSQAIAQNGQFDLNFLLNQVDCNSMKVSVDITLKASDGSSTFSVAEQNYRMSFPRNAVANPVITEELDLTGFTQLPDGTNVLYSPHSLLGSIDTVLSYNVELQSTEGIPISASAWTSVGRIEFDIIDTTKCFNLSWRTYSEIHYPNTVVLEKYNGDLYVVDEGTYVDLNVCFYDFCSVAPTVADDYINVLPNESFTFNLLNNDTDLNNDLDMSSFSLISTPPTQQISVTPTTNSGEIVCQPVAGFIGEVAPFEYTICDMDGQCSTGKVYITVDDAVTGINEPDNRYDIQLLPTAASDFITVQYTNIPTITQAQIVITDVNGRILQSHNKSIANNPSHRFEVSTLPQGVYFLSTMIEGKWIAKKFVKI